MQLREDTLTDLEMIQVVPFLKLIPEENDAGPTTFMGSLLKKQKTCHATAEIVSLYIDLAFVSSTSNTVERLFSMARLILTDYRKSMAPIVFEALLMLKVNHRLWDISDVAKAMRSARVEGVNDEDLSDDDGDDHALILV